MLIIYLIGTTTKAPSTSATTSTSAAASNHTSTGAIAGGVVGGIAVLAAFVFGIIWLYRRRRQVYTTASGNEAPQVPAQLHEMYPQADETAMKYMPSKWSEYRRLFTHWNSERSFWPLPVVCPELVGVSAKLRHLGHPCHSVARRGCSNWSTTRANDADKISR